MCHTKIFEPKGLENVISVELGIFFIIYMVIFTTSVRATSFSNKQIPCGHELLNTRVAVPITQSCDIANKLAYLQRKRKQHVFLL